MLLLWFFPCLVEHLVVGSNCQASSMVGFIMWKNGESDQSCLGAAHIPLVEGTFGIVGCGTLSRLHISSMQLF